ncbi:peptidase M16C associated-domain-containing protein [Chlamydoabsidia padenii]|nr:peptidase M16C associated-domain-containing protein [Chlamydoabsidia padenii]
MIQALLSSSCRYHPGTNSIKGSYSLLKSYTTKTLSVGDHLHGYKVHKVQQVKELELTATLLEHEQTGTQHLHIDRNDTNNVFAVGFHTPVNNSTGVAHVLEHTTLCGSHRYPVRDPFFKMLNRSLATYMNALTGSDYTVYPFATTNAVDYKNLQGVYMDAAFHPLLTELDFKQEGWRLEHDDLTDNSSPMNFKGVVYNEMKGRVSDPNYLFYKQSQQAMYLGTTYENASGGDPAFITDLTYDDLLNFHRTHYHPSNAKFYTYGNFSLEDHLATIHAKLSGFGKLDIALVNKIPDVWTEPKKIKTTCTLDPSIPADRQNRVSQSFLTNDIHDSFETFSMRLLSTLLLDGHSSPMYKALIDSHIGTTFSSNTGYNGSTRISSFTVGLQGIKGENVDQVEQLIKQVLEQVKVDGFDQNRIEAALHQMELGQKHKTARFGLTIMNSITSGWFNGADPIDLLQINKYIERLRQELQKGPFFESLIDKYLLGNPHMLTYVMQPDVTFQTTQAQEEKDRLERKIAQVKDADSQQKIMDQAQQLASKQNTTDDLSCLPTLRMDDIPIKQSKIVVEHTGLCNTPIQWRTTSTNGITYFRAICTLPLIDDGLKQYLPLFCDALHSLGTKTQDMGNLDDEIRLYTGGLGFSTNTSTHHSDIDAMEEGIVITGNCLDRNIEKMYDLTRRLIQETNFHNLPKLKTLINGNASYLNNSIVNSGHIYAKSYASSTLTPSSASDELLSGLTYIKFINQLAAEDDLTKVANKLEQLAAMTIHQSSLRVAIACGEEAINENIKHLSGFIGALPTSASTRIKTATEISSFEPFYNKTFFPVSSLVDFSAKSLRGVPYTHPDSARLQVLASLMTSHYLHREIREKNGAYGGGAVYGPLSGLMTFYSYRDPNSLATLDTYHHARDWVLNHASFTDQDLTEAKLSIFQQVDAPLNVYSEGMPQFIHGLSDLMRQTRREQLLSVTSDEVTKCAELYLGQAYGATVLGNESSAKNRKDDWITIVP